MSYRQCGGDCRPILLMYLHGPTRPLSASLIPNAAPGAPARSGRRVLKPIFPRYFAGGTAR
jgi:hypothetical protein